LAQVNFVSHLLVTKAFLPEMKSAKQGRIINISSVAGELHITPNAVYMASKQGMNAWTVALHCELKRFNIICKMICPGRIQTNFFRHPSFRTRKHRPEAAVAMPVQIGAAKIYKHIFDSSLLSFVPRQYAFLAWVFKCLPFVERLVLHRLLVKRIDDLYLEKN
jgi:short-subunit dehydrogenase